VARHTTGERLLTIGEAAAQLSVHPNTLRGWAKKGLVPFIRLPSGMRRFSQAQVAEIRETMYRPARSEDAPADKRLRPAAA
jgi:excisionase family DNA binding protein